MKIFGFMTAFFSASLAFAGYSSILFCNAGHTFELSISGDQLSLSFDGQTVSDRISKTLVLEGADVQEDSELIGESVLRSIAYQTAEQELTIGVVEGASGNTYLIDVFPYRLLGDTQSCK